MLIEAYIGRFQSAFDNISSTIRSLLYRAFLPFSEITIAPSGVLMVTLSVGMHCKSDESLSTHLLMIFFSSKGFSPSSSFASSGLWAMRASISAFSSGRTGMISLVPSL